MKRWTLGLAVAALVIAGCGGGGGGNGDKDQITQVIKDVGLKPDPNLCKTAFTAKYVKEQFTNQKQCVSSFKPENVSKSVDVTEVTVIGTKAQARAKLDPPIHQGGDPSGGNVFCLVKQGTSWRLDELAGLSCGLEFDNKEG